MYSHSKRFQGQYGNSKHTDDEAMIRISIIKIRDHVCRVMQSLAKSFVSPEIVLGQTELPAQDRPVGSLPGPGLFLQRRDLRSNAAPKLRVSRSLVTSETCRFGHVSSSSFMSAHRSCATASRCGCGPDCFTVVSQQLQLALWSPEFVARPPAHPWQPLKPPFCAMPSMSLLTLSFTHL